VRAPGASLRNRRLVYRIGRLGPRQTKTFTLTVNVKRRPRAVAVLLRAALFARDDVNPRDNVARDRARLSRRRARSRAASIASLAGTERVVVSPAARRRAEADHRLARRNRALSSSDQGAVDARALSAASSAFGFACRL
jgi:hypothetical protein